MKKLLVVLIAFTTYASAWALEPREFLTENQLKSFDESDTFLKKMGFEDYAIWADDTLADGKDVSGISKLALKLNADEYSALIGARHLANLAYVSLNETLQSKDKENFIKKYSILMAMTKQQLMPFPLISIDRVEHDSNSNIDDRFDIQKAEGFKKANARYLKESTNISKAFNFLLGLDTHADRGAVIEWIDYQVADAIMKNYKKHNKQQAKYLGRALVATLAKFSRENNLPNLEQKLRMELLKENILIDNFLDPVHKLKNSEKQLVTIVLKSGDLAYEYSHGDEAFFTSLVVRPSSSEDKALATKFGLLGKYTDAPKFAGKSPLYIEALDKMNTDIAPSIEEQKVFDTFWNPKYAKGFSHSGIVEIRHDKKTDISIVWIWDIFPDSGKVGAVRLLNPESFSVAEHHLKVGYSRHSPTKMLALYKEQLKERGHLENIWESFSSFYGDYIDGSGSGPVIDDQNTYTWKTKIDKKTFESWKNIESSKAEEWYTQTVLPKVFKRIQSYVHTKDAKVFADGLLSAKDMLYCSQMIAMAYLEGVNIDIQPNHDTVPNILMYANNKMKFFDARGITYRLVSPNGLIWQSKLTEHFQEVIFDQSESFYNLDKKAATTLISKYTNMLESFEEVRSVSIESFEFYMLDDKTFEIIDYRI